MLIILLPALIPYRSYASCHGHNHFVMLSRERVQSPQHRPHRSFSTVHVDHSSHSLLLLGGGLCRLGSTMFRSIPLGSTFLLTSFSSILHHPCRMLRYQRFRSILHPPLLFLLRAFLPILLASHFLIFSYLVMFSFSHCVLIFSLCSLIFL